MRPEGFISVYLPFLMDTSDFFLLGHYSSQLTSKKEKEASGRFFFVS